MKWILPLLLLIPSFLQAAEPSDFDWPEHWPRFRKSEYVATGAAFAGSAAALLWLPHPKTPAWRGQVLFDKDARNFLMAPTQAGRDRATQIADIAAYPLVFYAVADGPIAAGWAGGNRDTGMQLLLIGAETFAVTELLNLTVSAAIRRQRPEGNVCDPNAKYDSHCARSFWSGHTANVFAAASLVCAQHRAFPLYGGGAADGLACAGALAAASGIGVLRIASNDHHATDVAVGAVVGALTGFVMPNLLHFKFEKDGGRYGHLIPSLIPGGAGLTYVKAW